MLSLNGYLNLKSEGPIDTRKQALVQEDSHEVSVHVKNHITMYNTVNMEDTIDVTLSNITDHDTSPFLPTFHVMVLWSKEGKKYKHKAPSPCRQNRMLHAIIRCQDAIIRKSTKFKSSLLHFNKLDIDNHHLSTNSEYDDHSGINFPLQFAPNQVDSTTNLLDNVVLTEVVLRPIKKPRSVGPHRSIWKKTRSKKKSLLKNNKLRSVGKPLCLGSVDPDSDNNIVPQQVIYGGSVDPGYDGGENIIPQQSIFYTNGDMRTYPLMDNGESFPIIT